MLLYSFFNDVDGRKKSLKFRSSQVQKIKRILENYNLNRKIIVMKRLT